MLIPFYHEKRRPRAALWFWKLLAFLTVLALLVSNTAAGLTSGLAGGLALAATAVLCALAKILGIKSLNMLHNYILRNDYFLQLYHIKT